MKLVKAIWILLTVMLLASCGGGGDAGDSPFGNGGGGGGGGTTDEPSLSITLQDNAGAVLSPPALTGSQNAVVVVRLLDADGNGVPNSLVAVSGSGVIFTPATGQTITDATGTARVQVSAEDPFASGATTISAAGSVDGTAVQASIDVALGAATAELGA